MSDDPTAVGDLRGTPSMPRTPGGTASVLCIAGRGPLDEEASAMLAQLLIRRGIPARVVPHSATTRNAIGALDTRGVAMVCISYVATTGSPSHARYLLRRLRGRLPPEVQVLIGFWPEGEEILHDERLRAALGANYYTSSLREAVETCLTAAHGMDPGAQPAP
jgi:siroheme synthase (precorrin-2 oxidase/ferrochelatase)